MNSGVAEGQLVKDMHDIWCWVTREGEMIQISNLNDQHLRNIAMFLAGFGYQPCGANDRTRIVWLTILKKEWERRLLLKQKQGIQKWSGINDKLEVSKHRIE